MFFDELKRCLLTRKDGKYTLGRDDFNHLLGINDTMVLTPDQNVVATLAATTYLLGLLDININCFTSVASGYLANYGNDEQNRTLLISGYENFNRTEIMRLCEDKIAQNDNEIYNYIISQLRIGTSLIECSLNVSRYINMYLDENDKTAFQEKISSSKKEFDRANQQNCSDNHKILCKIIFESDSLAEDLNAIKDIEDIKKINSGIHELATKKYNMDEEQEQRYTKQMLNAVRLYRKVLHKFILPGYLTYRGRDRDNNKIKQDSQILNNVDRIKSLIDLLKNNLENNDKYNLLQAVTLILNMCSTDYTADMAFDFLNSISEYRGQNTLDDSTNLIDLAIPKTEDNMEQKRETRSVIYK